ncbi:MAG TPA: ATP-dependent DNA helicase, partial [Wenzhouxiangella sp.]|nr:ATP-dependent DNA helicase [Wenzhouxiangella sp.]
MTGAAQLAGAFEAGGAIARVLPSFRPRAGQRELAGAIEDCLNKGTDLIAEAATGTGKTLAYLVPVLLRDQRTIISTGTLNLQDQLYWRDLPLAIKALGVERKTALLKGRRNYLCHHRLEQHVSAPERYAGFMDELRIVQRWARHTVRGEISEIEEIPSDSKVWPLVTSTPDNCLGKECPFFEDCHLVKARRRAQDADIVVVNHHLLFADMALKQGGFGEVLPGAETVVIDEAHQVPDTAMRFFSRRVSAWQLRELARETLAAASGVTGGIRLLQNPVAALRSVVDQAVSTFADLPARGEYSRLGSVVGQLEKLAVALKELAAALEALEGSSREVDNCGERAVGLHENLTGFLAGKEGHVRWFTNNNGRFQLNLTPLDVSEPLRELREQAPANWVMTSATLAVKGRFGHYTRRLGLAPETELVIESPFDYARQSRLWLPDGLPNPGSPAHTAALMEKILPLVAAAGGRTFLLFTSHRALQAAARWLRSNSDYNLFVQQDAPRQVLLSRFAKTPRSLLLGAASFWEGVDVPGKALSMVVID